MIDLKISLENLKERLHDAAGRGVVLKEGQTIEGLYRERIILYERYADLVVDEGKLDFDGVVQAVIDAI